MLTDFQNSSPLGSLLILSPVFQQRALISAIFFCVVFDMCIIDGVVLLCAIRITFVYALMYSSLHFFTALHLCRAVLPRANVCLYVRLSIKRVNCDKTNETYAWKNVVFRHEEFSMGATPCTWNFGPNWPRSSKNADIQSIFARWRLSRKTLQKSSTPIGSLLGLYVRSNEPKMNVVHGTLPVSCGPNGGSKTHYGLFPSKIALHLKEVCHKISLCENCQRQVKAFTGLSIRAKMIGGGPWTSPTT